MKKATQAVIAIVFSLLATVNIGAQSLSILNKDLQRVRVGLVDEFFSRFNGQTVHPDLAIKDNDIRRSNLMVLLDLAKYTSKDDPQFQEGLKMMDVVINDSVKINFSDTTWVAIAHCKGLLEGKSVKLDLYLTVQQRGQGLYKWVISRADGNIFDIAPRNESEKIMLLPGDHETNFMSLGRMTKEQPFNVKNFMARGFEYDMTSVFAYLVYNKKLKIDYVNDLEFVFTQVPGYIFHVNYFERESKNSGWLISNFYKSTDEEKAAFLGRLFPQKFEGMPISVPIEENGNQLDNNTVNVGDTIDHRAMFIKRRSEKLSQLLDNISFMQDKDTLRARTVYQKKTEALFADSSHVYLQYKRKSNNLIVDVPTFCRLLIDGVVKFERIDSVCIALWDDKINSVPTEVNKVELESVLLPFEAARGEVVCEKTSPLRKLFAYKEDTEDGIEWIPVFGDLVVKVKK